LWTLERIGDVIRRQFRMRYSPVGETNGRGQKNAARRGAHLVFLDESGFLPIPNVRLWWF